MGFFFNLNHKKTKCPNGCQLFNDKRLFSYWENKKSTADEKYILYFLKKKISINQKNILHVGVGNSYLADKLFGYNKIDGITLSSSEITIGKKKKIKNYKIYFLNKFSKKSLFNNILCKYDIIIDVNLKSYACCDYAFEMLFKNYINMLNKNGIIITAKNGMRWSRIVKPVLSFSFKNFFYKRLKEFDGPKKNILHNKDLYSLKKKYNLKILNLSKLILIKKR